MFKLGKKPARDDAVKLKLASYLKATALPALPAAFGHEGVISSWPMFANDQYGDCVWAGAAHETMMLTTLGGHAATFTDANVLSDYSAVTGFVESDPSTDNGTDMQTAASYRRKTGIVDAAGNRHTIAAYLALEPGNLDHLCIAAYLFGAVGIGLQLPGSALDAAANKQPWYYTAGSQIEGGHYVPLVGKRADGIFITVSWGMNQLMSTAFLSHYCDEAIAYVSTEDLINQKSPEGFDYATLLADLKELT